MSSFWVQFEDGVKGCVESRDGMDKAAMKAANVRGIPIKSIQPIPYPAYPMLGERVTDIPLFCGKPDSCVGNGYCKHDPACNE